MKPYRVGILGGMGPLAGVELHRLLIHASAARTDQDHLQVVLFTDPTIPDRTISLNVDDGREFARAAGLSARLLEEAGVDIIAIACMTAHARLSIIRQSVATPILDGVALTAAYIEQNHHGKTVVILATQGTIDARLFERAAPSTRWAAFAAGTQRYIDQAIAAVKAGDQPGGLAILLKVMKRLDTSTHELVFLLGCTELGLQYEALREHGYHLVDPLRLMAAALARPRPASPA